MPEPFVVRRLGEQDVRAMRDLNTVFGRAFGEPETYGAAPPRDSWLRALLGKEHVIVLAAFADETVVGGLVAYEMDKFEQERREIYIYDLAVAQEHRRRGIATALVGRLSRIASDRDAWVVYVQADYGDDPAVALYEKLGTREEVMHFDIAINRNGTAS